MDAKNGLAIKMRKNYFYKSTKQLCDFFFVDI